MSKSKIAGLSGVVAVVWLLGLGPASADEWDPTCGCWIRCTSNCSSDSGSASGYYNENGWGARAGQWINQQLTGEARRNNRIEQATNINNQGVVYYNARNYAAALPLYRQAFELNPNSAVIRLNLMMAINGVAYENLQLARNGRDLSGLSRIESSLAEVDRLNTSDLTGLPDYATVVNVLARLRSDIADARAIAERDAQNGRALANASRDIAAITQDLSATLQSQRARSNTPQATGLGFGDPSVTQVNPGALTQDAAAAAAGPARERLRPGDGGALAEARRAASGQATGITFDGGNAHTDANPVADLREITTPPSQRVFTPEQLERYNSSPAFVAANATVQRERQAAESARARQATLERQSAATSDTQARQRIQIEISNNSQELMRAETAVRAAEVELEEAITVVEGAPIIRGSRPGAAQQAPAQQAPTAPR